MFTSRPTLDVTRFERWLAKIPASVAVKDWQVQGLDVWPLFSTCLVSLAILISIKHRKARAKVGGAGWQAGVLIDYTATAPLRWLASSRRNTPLPEGTLANHIVYCGSKVHARALGDVLVTAPLDVPATLMRRAGHASVFWFEDMGSDDERLGRCLNRPAYGMAGVLRAAQAKAWRFSAALDLDRLPGFSEWCREAAGMLSLSRAFLRLWLARQVELALATAHVFGGAFDSLGRPKLLVLLNGGFASTVGLTAAAKARRIPVVEVQHGADSEAAVTAPGIKPHFSAYNSAPDALITWEISPRSDPAVLAMGPIGLHVPSVVESPHASDQNGHKMLRCSFEGQKLLLAAHAERVNARREVLVSLQPGDEGLWIEDFVRSVGSGVLYWVRRHGADLGNDLNMRRFADVHSIEFELASSCALPQLLARVNAHLTRFSAVALEAAACGVPTIAVEAYARELYARNIPASLLDVETDHRAAALRLKTILEMTGAIGRVHMPKPENIAEFLERCLRVDSAS
jgi:hypothetical protein